MRQIASQTRRPLRCFAILAASTLALITARDLLGQVPPASDPTFQQIQPPSRTLPLPELPSPVPQPQFRLPPITPPQELRAPGGPRFFVRRVELEGNTVFSTETLKHDVAGAFENRMLSSEDLQDLRHRLSLFYIQRGYVNSGAVLPDQKIQDGVVRIQIIEGRLAGVELSGNRALGNAYLRDRLLLGSGQPLNVNDIRQQMLLLQQDPLIARINAELVPGTQPGEAILKARVEENQPYRIGMSYGNNRSPAVGSERGEIQLTHMSLTGHGDPLSMRLGRTNGLTDSSLSYALPITARDLQLRMRLDHYHSVVVEEPFNVLDIRSRSSAASLGLNYPVIRTPTRELQLGATIEHRKSLTSLLGTPFSFSPGVQDGRSATSALRLSQEWIMRDVNQIFAARSTFSLGLRAFNSTVNSDGPDSRFFTWLGQAQWIKRLDEGLGRVVIRGDLQWSRDELLPLEKYAVGGATSVRGYRENQFVRDNGYAASAEYRYPLARLALPGLTQTSDEGWIELAPFIDWGSSWNKGNPSTRLASVGAGIRWEPAKGLAAQLYVAHASPKIELAGQRSLQDKGIHFLLTYLYF